MKKILSLTDASLDFSEKSNLKKSYIVASSYRSGSTYLCTSLWETGLLGAPWEYLNYYSEMNVMAARMGVATPEAFLQGLIDRRTTRNGVFGLKAHFQHFEAALKRYPKFLDVLAPVRFIYIKRGDVLAQAVSMAKAFQTNAWTSLTDDGQKQAKYDTNQIKHCLEEIEVQSSGWLNWFEEAGITPYTVLYEDLLADRDKVVREIVDFMGVGDDTPTPVSLPEMKKQGDSTNEQWISQFQAG